MKKNHSQNNYFVHHYNGLRCILLEENTTKQRARSNTKLIKSNLQHKKIKYKIKGILKTMDRLIIFLRFLTKEFGSKIKEKQAI